MGDWNFVLKRSTAFETVLRKRLGARGNGLASLTSNVACWLPPGLCEDLRVISRYRNRVAHTQLLLDEVEATHFGKVCDRARLALNTLLSEEEDYGEEEDEWDVEPEPRAQVNVEDALSAIADDEYEEQDEGERLPLFEMLKGLDPRGFLRDLFFSREYQDHVGRKVVPHDQV